MYVDMCGARVLTCSILMGFPHKADITGVTEVPWLKSMTAFTCRCAGVP